MKTTQNWTLSLAAMLVCALAAPLHAALLTNGGFESGFTGWTRVDQIGSDGTFAAQTGTASPVNSFTVPAPPEGLTAAMTDALGPGSHVLYQDFTVPATGGPFFVGVSLYINNNHGAGDYFVPGGATGLDFATPALNQQARVDIISPSADPFSVAPADILQNLFKASPGDPLVSGYNSFLVDVTSLFQANASQTLRLRFAEVDNVAPFNMGVDAVAVGALPASVSVTKAVSGTLVPGGLVIYTVVLSNSGPGTQADNPGDEFTDVLPAQLTLVSASATSGTALANGATNTVTWNGSIAAGGSVTIIIRATVKPGVGAGTPVSNQGTASYDADGDGTNEASARTDDPAGGGGADPTQFVVAAQPAPALDRVGLALLTLLLVVVAALMLRPRAGA